MVIILIYISLLPLKAHSTGSLSETVITQEKVTISGTVKDENGETLPGTTILEKGTNNGTITNAEGNYSISVEQGAVLVISFVGMETQEVSIGNQTTIDIVLIQAAIGLDEVVAIGYGSQSRRFLTTSIAKVDGDVLENIPISSVGEGLKGKVPGVRIYSNNTAPGADPIIRIRGGSSINKSNAPLILIDGVELNLSDINPHDIESIEVLKDAASTAIYGSRASNGVILVTTKRGTLNKAPRITFQTSLARQEIERFYNFLNAAEYLSLTRPLVAESPFPERNDISGYSASSGNDENSVYTTRFLQPGESVPEGWESMPDPLDPSKTLIFKDSDMKSILFNPALWQDYNLGIDGGADALRYSGSIGYTTDEGVGLATGWERFSARVNADANISSKLKLSTNFSYTQSSTEEYYNQRNVIIRGLSNPPTHRLYWEDGTPAAGNNKSMPNPLWNEYTRDENRKDQRLILGSGLDWNIIDKLHVNISGSLYTRTWQRDYFELAHEYNSSRPAESEFSQTRKSQFEAYFSYNKTFGKHSLSAVAGYSYLDIFNKDLKASTLGSSTDKIQTLNAGPEKSEASSEIHEETLIGYFGRINYDFNKKYLVSAVFRRDGSSKFVEGNQWGFFPGVSAAWIISEEPFFDKISPVSLLKFRTSYGQMGNNSVGLYDAQGRFSADYIYDGNAGIRPTAMPNQNLTWETCTQLDAGFDMGLLNDRIVIIADYFTKITENLLFSKLLPNTSGFSSVQTNIGEVKFYGFDFNISSNNIRTSDFEWNTNFTLSFVKNEVLKLPENGRDKNRIGGYVLGDGEEYGEEYGGIAEGEPLYRYYAYMVDYIIQTQEQADNALFDQLSRGWDPADGKKIKGRKFPGDYEWVDRDGDGKISSLDQFLMGVTVPHTTGGMANNFKYKNLSLNLYLDWALGHSVMDQGHMRYFMLTHGYNCALSEEVYDTWTPENPDANYARLVANDPGDNSGNLRRKSDKYNDKADYLCIREVTLNYDVPGRFIDRLGIQKLNVYVAGNNLHYFTALKYISPEPGASSTYSSSGYANYPPIRRYSIGLKVTF
ncbi:MAG: TonB-dependent receptor [Bacteroidales bacterium]|nr:TonB-dependent receptor [Bacteroidales bacterium]